jgi:hypothetical protein
MEVMEIEDKIIAVLNDILKKHDYEILKLERGYYGMSYWKSDIKLCMMWRSFDRMLFELDEEHITLFDYFNDKVAELIGLKHMARNTEHSESLIPECLWCCYAIHQEIEFLKSSCLEELVMKIQLCGGKIR